MNPLNTKSPTLRRPLRRVTVSIVFWDYFKGATVPECKEGL